MPVGVPGPPAPCAPRRLFVGKPVVGREQRHLARVSVAIGGTDVATGEMSHLRPAHCSAYNICFQTESRGFACESWPRNCFFLLSSPLH